MEFLMKSSRLIVTSRTITRRVAVPIPRMGSFNSAPKINNIDSQDDDLEIPKGLNTNELLQHVKLLRGEQFPQLLSRYFMKPLASPAAAAAAAATASPSSSSLSSTSSPSIPQLSSTKNAIVTGSGTETASAAPLSTSNDITDGLRYLQLNTVSRVCSAPLSASPNHIRLLQWNILSQTLGQNNDGFVRCPEEALTWENRKFLIVQEVLQHNPDIVCLQEVDHFKFLQTILGTQNYEGIFFPKPDSPCLYIEENNGPDGCAIFFKRDKFELKNFETRILEVWRVQSNQVAIAANLYVKAIDREICVCTTHLKARQGSLLAKLRNEQGRDLIRFVRNMAGDEQQQQQQQQQRRPVILCGDFNAEPIEPVYGTMLSCEKLKLSSAYSDIRRQENANMIGKDMKRNSAKHKEKEKEAKVEGGGVAMEAKANRAINCDEEIDVDVEREGESDEKDNAFEDYVRKSIQYEPPYTTWKIREDGEECHTIDYVFYAKDQLKVVNCLEFPPEDDIGNNRTPSFQYPSDHFSLVCDFEILDNPQRKESESKLKAQ